MEDRRNDNTDHKERVSKIEGRVPRHQPHGAKRNVALIEAKNTISAKMITELTWCRFNFFELILKTLMEKFSRGIFFCNYRCRFFFFLNVNMW